MRLPRCYLSTRRLTRMDLEQLCNVSLPRSLLPPSSHKQQAVLHQAFNILEEEGAPIAISLDGQRSSSSTSSSGSSCTHQQWQQQHLHSCLPQALPWQPCVNCYCIRWCASIPLPITQPPSDHPGITVHPLFACPCTMACTPHLGYVALVTCKDLHFYM